MIRIGVDPAYAPYAFFGPDGQPAGIAAEISALVAQQLGVRFEPVRNLSWPEILEAARLRELDLITTANRRPEREAYLAFSQQYLATPTVIMTRNDAARLQDAEALSGQRVALVKAYSSTQAFLDAGARRHAGVCGHPAGRLAGGLFRHGRRLRGRDRHQHLPGQSERLVQPQGQCRP